jgi:hypothetical protein
MPRLLWYSDGNENPWVSWYERQDSKVRGRHDIVMRMLENGHWNEPFFKHLGGFEDLQEIRITKGAAHRRWDS